MSGRKRNSKRRNARSAMPRTPAVPTEQQWAAVYATCFNILLTALVDDSRIDAEAKRIEKLAGRHVVGGVVGFLAADAAKHHIQKHGSRKAAIDAVTAELAAMTLNAGET